MIDREFDVRAYEEGYRAGKHDAQVEIDRLRNEVREWRKMDDQIRNFVGGKRDGRNTLEIVKEKFTAKWDDEDHSYRLLLDSYTHPIIELLQAENERLRRVLEIAANDLDHCGACTDADNARAELEGKHE